MSLVLENFEQQLQKMKAKGQKITYTDSLAPDGIKSYTLGGQFPLWYRILRSFTPSGSADFRLNPILDDSDKLIGITFLRDDRYSMHIKTEDYQELEKIVEPLGYKMNRTGDKIKIQKDEKVVVYMSPSMWELYAGKNKEHMELVDSILIDFIGIPRERVRREPLSIQVTH
jgi:hypothetical protein